MSESRLDFEPSILARARYPKGRRTLQAILDATYDVVIEEGLGAASQEAIARRAQLTQSAARHYFPTKADLLLAFFTTGIERLQALLREMIAAIGSDPRTQIIESAALQFDRMLEVQDVYFFEAAAYWGRNPGARETRDRWYQTLCR
jgi:AcrR family transcriptional regulator